MECLAKGDCEEWCGLTKHDLHEELEQEREKNKKLLKIIHRANDLLAVKSGYEFYDDEFEDALKDYKDEK